MQCDTDALVECMRALLLTPDVVVTRERAATYPHWVNAFPTRHDEPREQGSWSILRGGALLTSQCLSCGFKMFELTQCFS
jgi:hypothetical protein